MAKETRFVTTYSQNLGFTAIVVDKVTGVNYLYMSNGQGCGLTPLLDRDGKPVISALPIEEKK